ncbi:MULTISPECIES: protein kinase domain-containing protein [unclassified Coleofasciculus]|uniref:protein kinase domain-containing protein n=1 Tax=unclassified Coleofasciculus TaxID=2692782 RepID=UPI001880B0B2|nr:MULTISPECIES: protein kinase [unclassified Coleofasciculus]MBE9125477.1 protein kinase [Coleofasciculus sp. LEGE 07081]MBE9147448.1 protein kinase [Coleofasciculus sp. LEGE 07092]
MLGKLLDGRYYITQVLGAGGFGRTYLAQDTRRPGNPICVVKHLQPANQEPSFLETARRLFTSEAETLEQLGNHDQIPRLLAYFEEDQEFYLVQEFVEGHTLSQELQPGQRWDEKRVMELLKEVLGIVDFVHRHGVIHRDIKPDNLIRRNSDNKLVLVDFGAVKQIRTQLASGYGSVNNTVAVGTPGYMSSEQAMGQPRPSSDIYGLGIIGIQALTGRMPAELQEDLNTGEILWQHLVSISRGLAYILNRMVSYHFKDRYQSAGEALQALQQLTASPSSYSPTNPAYPSAQGISTPRQTLPPHNPAPLSEQATMAVAPAAPPRPPAPTPTPPSSYPPPSRSDKLPLVLGIGMAIVVGGVSMAYAIRQSSLGAFGDGVGTCTVAVGVLNVRSQPQGSVVDTVSKGTKLALTGTEQNGWAEISSPAKGWVFKERQYIDCTSANPTVAQTQPSPTPVETQPSPVVINTPAPKPSPEKPKDKPKPADNGDSKLTTAAEKYQQGKLDEAIADAQSVLPSSPAFEEAQKKIGEWQQEWSEAKAKFNNIQQAFDEGRYVDVIIYASDSNFPEQRYWREKLNDLVRKATQRKADTEGNQETPPSPTQPETQNPKPNPQESVDPSPAATGGNPVTP